MTRKKFLSLLPGTLAVLFCGRTLPGTTIRKGASSTSSYNFLFCNDLHITAEKDTDLLAKGIDLFNAMSHEHDFVVFGGDLANDGTAQELYCVANYLEKLTIPWYPVIGNHDVSGTSKAGYREVFGEGKENYVIFHKKTALVFLDLTNAEQAHVSIQEHTVKWLERALSAISEKTPILVFSHFPLHSDTPRFPAKNTAPLFELLDKRVVLGYLGGHYHGNWKGIRQRVPFFSSACLSSTVHNHDNSVQKGFLTVNVTPASMHPRFIPVLAG